MQRAIDSVCLFVFSIVLHGAIVLMRRYRGLTPPATLPGKLAEPQTT